MSMASVTCLDKPNIYHEATAQLLRPTDTGNYWEQGAASLVNDRSPFMTVVADFVTERNADRTSFPQLIEFEAATSKFEVRKRYDSLNVVQTDYTPPFASGGEAHCNS